MSWPSIRQAFVLVFGAFHSVCYNLMVVGALGPALSSSSLGYFVRCRPMCLQRVHCSVSLALWREF